MLNDHLSKLKVQHALDLKDDEDKYLIGYLIKSSDYKNKEEQLFMEFYNIHYLISYWIKELNKSTAIDKDISGKFAHISRGFFIMIQNKIVLEESLLLINKYKDERNDSLIKKEFRKLQKSIVQLMPIIENKSFSMVKQFVFESFNLNVRPGIPLFYRGDWEDELNRKITLLQFILRPSLTIGKFVLNDFDNYVYHYLHFLFTNKILGINKLKYSNLDNYKVKFFRYNKTVPLTRSNIANYYSNTTPPHDLVQFFAQQCKIKVIP